MDWNTSRRWVQLVERRLNEIGSLVRGNQAFEADRLADVIELIDQLKEELQTHTNNQIERLRNDLTRVAERQDKIADYVKKNVRNGAPDGSGNSN